MRATVSRAASDSTYSATVSSCMTAATWVIAATMDSEIRLLVMSRMKPPSIFSVSTLKFFR